jgi:hypothetical protein
MTDLTISGIFNNRLTAFQIQPYDIGGACFYTNPAADTAIYAFNRHESFSSRLDIVRLTGCLIIINNYQT